MSDDFLWQTKLAARIHDPAEKALVLLRDPAGHEGGTSRALIRLLGLGEPLAENIDPDDAAVLSTVIFKNGLPRKVYQLVRRADWWAAAADRPQWPMPKAGDFHSPIERLAKPGTVIKAPASRKTGPIAKVPRYRPSWSTKTMVARALVTHTALND